MSDRFSIGEAVQSRGKTLGTSAAITTLRHTLVARELVATAGSFQAAADFARYRWPDDGPDREIPPDFWWHDWPEDGEATISTQDSRVHLKADWERGNFALTIQSGRFGSMLTQVVASDVTLDRGAVAAIFPPTEINSRINSQKVPDAENVREWIRNRGDNRLVASWKDFTRQYGKGAVKREFFDAEFRKEYKVNGKGRPKTINSPKQL